MDRGLVGRFHPTWVFASFGLFSIFFFEFIDQLCFPLIDFHTVFPISEKSQIEKTQGN